MKIEGELTKHQSTAQSKSTQEKRAIGCGCARVPKLQIVYFTTRRPMLKCIEPRISEITIIWVCFCIPVSVSP